MTANITPRKVTIEQIKAVSSVDPLYKIGAQVMLKKGLWVLQTEEPKEVW